MHRSRPNALRGDFSTSGSDDDDIPPSRTRTRTRITPQTRRTRPLDDLSSDSSEDSPDDALLSRSHSTRRRLLDSDSGSDLASLSDVDDEEATLESVMSDATASSRGASSSSSPSLSARGHPKSKSKSSSSSETRTGPFILLQFNETIGPDEESLASSKKASSNSRAALGPDQDLLLLHPPQSRHDHNQKENFVESSSSRKMTLSLSEGLKVVSRLRVLLVEERQKRVLQEQQLRDFAVFVMEILSQYQSRVRVLQEELRLKEMVQSEWLERLSRSQKQQQMTADATKKALPRASFAGGEVRSDAPAPRRFFDGLFRKKTPAAPSSRRSTRTARNAMAKKRRKTKRKGWFSKTIAIGDSDDEYDGEDASAGAVPAAPDDSSTGNLPSARRDDETVATISGDIPWRRPMLSETVAPMAAVFSNEMIEEDEAAIIAEKEAEVEALTRRVEELEIISRSRYAGLRQKDTSIEQKRTQLAHALREVDNMKLEVAKLTVDKGSIQATVKELQLAKKAQQKRVADLTSECAREQLAVTKKDAEINEMKATEKMYSAKLAEMIKQLEVINLQLKEFSVHRVGRSRTSEARIVIQKNPSNGILTLDIVEGKNHRMIALKEILQVSPDEDSSTGFAIQHRDAVETFQAPSVEVRDDFIKTIEQLSEMDDGE